MVRVFHKTFTLAKGFIDPSAAWSWLNKNKSQRSSAEMKTGTSLASPVEPGVLRRYASDQIVTLAKLVVENAFQPIVEAGTGTVFGYESLMRGQ
ncbi:GGDEF domain-containing protein, partial [Pseudomonas sp. BGM005]|nr:GGDEF domain-containing protein [Pseudomonas sp. BG5]